MNIKALINTVESLLATLPPRPWKMNEWGIMVDAQGKEIIEAISEEADKPVLEFIQDGCEMMEELVEALKEADENLVNALMREQRTLEEMEGWMDRAIKAEAKIALAEAVLRQEKGEKNQE